MAENTTQIIEYSPYVIKAFPAGDKWHARGMLGECVAAAGEGATAEQAIASVKERLPAKRQPARTAAFAGAGGFGFVQALG